jgi:hypothetical protein
MNIIVTDHLAKLQKRMGEHATIQALLVAFQTTSANWTAAYTKWRNKRAAYRAATRALEALLDVLKLSPGNGQRSKIDEWNSKISALWAPDAPMYLYFFPEGRDPFTSGGRDNIVKEVGDLSQRLAEKIADLTALRDALQVQVDAITNGGGVPPEALADELDLAKARVDTVTSLVSKTAAFHSQLTSARSTQQGAEGEVDGAATQVENQRIIAARRLLANLYALGQHYVLLASEDADPQAAAGDFFDLDTIIQTTPDEEPDEDPAPAPVTPPTPPTP